MTRVAVLDDWQHVALHTLARDIGAAGALAACDLVDLIYKDDAGLLGARDRLTRDIFHVNQLGRLFLRKDLKGLGNLDLTIAGLLGHGRRRVARTHCV